MFSRPELEAAWESVLDHDRRAEVPDVIGWRDLHTAALGSRPVAAMPPTRYFVPKKLSSSLRRVDVLDPADLVRYVAIVARLAPQFERHLGACVTAHRVVSRGAGLRVQPWRRAWSAHRAAVGRLVWTGSGALAVADVRNCFARIRPEVLDAVLDRLGAPEAERSSLLGLTRRWPSAGGHGLPVGPDPSGVLANVILSPVDRAVGEEGARHARWVDDFVVAARDEAAARGVLHRLRVALAQLGLEVAPEKCRVVQGEEIGAFLHGPAATRSGGAGDPPPRPAQHAEAVFETLESGERCLSDPVVAGRVRSIAGRRWGRAETELLAALAESNVRSAPVRAWAWRALVRTDPGRCLERAAALPDDGDPWVQRAVVAALGLMGTARARRALRAIVARVPQAAATAAWGLER